MAPITLTSAQSALTGYVYVIYQDGKHASAEVSGEIADSAPGGVAVLYAQQFPYKNPPAEADSVILHPASGRAHYEFPVTPTLATRYRVELFRGSTVATPFAVSATATIYVLLQALTSSTLNCDGPVCRESATGTYTSPPSALPTEETKQLYLYFGLNRSAGRHDPATPSSLSLGAGDSSVARKRQISADQFQMTVEFSFTAGHGGWTLATNICVKDAVATDGIGLPGHHGCGDQSVPYPTRYLG
jgi:hypothetical protein